MGGEAVSSLRDGRILDFDPEMGITEKYYEIDGQWYIEHQQDVEGILELNKAQYNSTDERARYKKEVFNHVARLPLVVQEDLRQKGILNDKKAFLKWLDQPENRAFRTRPGRLS